MYVQPFFFRKAALLELLFESPRWAREFCYVCAFSPAICRQKNVFGTSLSLWLWRILLSFKSAACSSFPSEAAHGGRCAGGAVFAMSLVISNAHWAFLCPGVSGTLLGPRPRSLASTCLHCFRMNAACPPTLSRSLALA